MPDEYNEGRTARKNGLSIGVCPYGMSTANLNDNVRRRERSPLALRSWWLAGWHDADIELLKSGGPHADS